MGFNSGFKGLRADSASTRVCSLVSVLFEDAKLVADLNAKQLVKKVCGNVMAMLNIFFHKRFTMECCTRPARINGQLFWCMGGSVRLTGSMYL